MMKHQQNKAPRIELGEKIYVDQFDTPFYSTIDFHDFLKKKNCFLNDKTYLDIGCGFGCVTYYCAEHNPSSQFLGVDYNDFCITTGNAELAKRNIKNLTLSKGDWFHLPDSMMGTFDGVFNVHTFICFTDFLDATEKLIALRPRWIAFNALFWNGFTDVFIQTKDIDPVTYQYDKHDIQNASSQDDDLNICSLPRLKKYFSENGYSTIYVEPFEIKQSLPKPADGRRTTYTIATEWSPRTQFTGPIYLPWHFVLAFRDKPNQLL